jgi:hypothetical protein
MLNLDRLKELLHYDPETGVFTRRISRTSAPAGTVAGSKHDGGYLTIWIGKAHKAHRLAWFYVHGRWPIACIDHIDGNRANNRIANLREATHADNAQNIRRAYSNNISSGLLGVYWHAAGKWQAKITVNGRAKSLGLYDTRECAQVAYISAKARLHPFQTLTA